MFAGEVTFIPQSDCIDYKLLGTVHWPQPGHSQTKIQKLFVLILVVICFFPWLAMAMPELWEPRSHFLYKVLKFQRMA